MPLLLAGNTTLFAEENAPAGMDGNNIARDKKYTFSTRPNYALCTDRDDDRQLTDGEIAEIPKEGRYWGQKPVVGWNKRDITIKIDLENIYPIENVALHTVGGGGAGVYFPSFISVFVSLDDKTYYNVANMSHIYKEIRDQQPDSYTRWFSSEMLNTKGRYVLLKIKTMGSFFCDEISITKGDFSADKVDLTEKPFATEYNLEDIVNAENLPPLRVMLNNLAVFEAKLAKVKIDPASVKPFKDEIFKIKGDIDKPEKSLTAMGRADINKRITKLFCRLYKNIYSDKNLIVWQKGLWDDVEPFASPEPGKNGGPAEIKVVMGKNEYESASFLIFNPTGKDADLELDFPDIKDVAMEKRYGYYVCPAIEKTITSDALPLLECRDGRYVVTVPAGETKQIWLTLKTADNIQSGDYLSKIEIRKSGFCPERYKLPGKIISLTQKFRAIFTRNSSDWNLCLNLKVNVLPVKMPSDSSLSLCNWAYIFKAPANMYVFNSKAPQRNYYPGLEAEIVEDNLSHYTTHCVIELAFYPFPKFDENGEMVGPIDFDGIDKQLEYVKKFKKIMFVMPRDKINDFGAGLQWLSPEWKNALNNWLSLFVNHLKEKNIYYDKFIMYPLDEPAADRKTWFIELASAIKEADPDIKIFVDFYEPYRWSEGEIENLPACVDMACLNFYHASIERPDVKLRVEILKNGKVAVWHYNNPTARKFISPYCFIQAFLFAFKYGLNGVGAWAYNQGWGKSFNDFDDYDYDALFSYDGRELNLPGNKGLIPSKRWEAWREGVEIYEYFNMLRSLTAVAKEKQLNPDMINEAKNVLRRATDKCLVDNPDNNLYFCNPDDYIRLQDAKTEVMELIVKLNQN